MCAPPATTRWRGRDQATRAMFALTAYGLWLAHWCEDLYFGSLLLGEREETTPLVPLPPESPVHIPSDV